MAGQKTLEKQQPADPGSGQGEQPGPLAVPQPPGELGGPKGPEPTRFGDWEVNGRCSDF
jgi:Protein of unknown function (DUF1674)